MAVMHRSATRYLAASILATILVFAINGVWAQTSTTAPSAPSDKPGDFLQTPPKPSSLKGEFSLVSLGELLYSYPMANSKDSRFQQVVKLIKSGDVTIANREGAIFNLKTFPYSHYSNSMLWGEASLGEDAKDMGIDMVSLANNHTMDWGGKTLLKTKQLFEHAGVVTAGAGRNLEEARRAGILDTPHGSIALIATTSTFKPNVGANDAFDVVRSRTGISILRTRVIDLVNKEQMESIRKLATERASPLDPAPAKNANIVRFGGRIYRLANRPGLTYQMDLYDLAGLLKSVREAKRVADLVVFYIHAHQTSTGDDDGTPVPPDFLIKLAHDTIDAGADVFMGGGLHSMRGIEIYKGKPIFYGLGAFLLNGEIETPQETALKAYPDAVTGLPPKPKPKSRSARPGGNPASWYDGVVAVTDFKDGKANTIRLYPLSLGKTNDYNPKRRGIPHLVGSENAHRILTILQKDSVQFGTKIDIDNSVGVIHIHH